MIAKPIRPIRRLDADRHSANHGTVPTIVPATLPKPASSRANGSQVDRSVKWKRVQDLRGKSKMSERRISVYQTVAFGHSATSPREKPKYTTTLRFTRTALSLRLSLKLSLSAVGTGARTSADWARPERRRECSGSFRSLTTPQVLDVNEFPSMSCCPRSWTPKICGEQRIARTCGCGPPRQAPV